MKHVKLKTINLKNHPKLNEPWLQGIIARDPSILGIGDVQLKDKERIHPGAGRLDLLLQETDGLGRYEVEIQLGDTDESHLCVLHSKAATDYTAKLPPISHESCHPLHGKAATPEEVDSRRV